MLAHCVVLTLLTQNLKFKTSMFRAEVHTVLPCVSLLAELRDTGEAGNHLDTWRRINYSASS